MDSSVYSSNTTNKSARKRKKNPVSQLALDSFEAFKPFINLFDPGTKDWAGTVDGEIRSDNGRWLTYCHEHVPQAETIRSLTTDGRLITPYEPDSLDTIRAMPGARWDKIARCWHVSTDLGDRERLLELADRLGLAVAPELRQVKHSEQAEHAHHAGLYPFQVQGVDWLSKRKTPFKNNFVFHGPRGLMV